jgi:hypothetical protein
VFLATFYRVNDCDYARYCIIIMAVTVCIVPSTVTYIVQLVPKQRIR